MHSRALLASNQATLTTTRSRIAASRRRLNPVFAICGAADPEPTEVARARLHRHPVVLEGNGRRHEGFEAGLAHRVRHLAHLFCAALAVLREVRSEVPVINSAMVMTRIAARAMTTIRVRRPAWW